MVRTPSFAAPRRLFAPCLLVAVALSTIFSPSNVAGQEAELHERRVLGHEAYEIWRTIGPRAISSDGAWVAYTLVLENADGELVVAATGPTETGAERELRFPRATGHTFTEDGAHLLFTIRPSREALREARSGRGGNVNANEPADTLAILTVASGDVRKIPHVQGWRLPSERSGWVAYHLTPEGSTAADEHAPRHGTLVLRDLVSGGETRHPHATTFSWANGGGLLVVTDSIPEEEGTMGVRAWTPGSDMTTVIESSGTIRSVAVSGAGDQVAFLHAPAAPSETNDAPDADGDRRAAGERTTGDNVNRNGPDGAEREWTLHHWRPGDPEARVVAGAGSTGIPDGWTISDTAPPSFSEDGGRLFFATVPPVPAPVEFSELEQGVDVEVWHWLDAPLMTTQNVRVNQERRRSYQAVVHLAGGRDGGRAGRSAPEIVQLATPELPQVNIPSGGRARFGVARDGAPYGIEASWESPSFADIHLVDVESGERTRILERVRGTPSLSPGGRFLTWYEASDSTWYVRDVASGSTRELAAGIPYPIWNERHDAPSPAGSYGSAGWIEGDRAILLHDRYDIWAVDPTGATAPRNVTGGAGRANGARYRIVRLEPGADPFPANAELLLSLFDPRTKEAGFARIRLDREGTPETLLKEDRSFSNPTKARNADRILFTQETFIDFPDLWVAGTDLSERRRISDANPQQADYRWGTVELVEWLSADGIPLQGVLMKPDDFDPNRKYPLVVYFYERWSDGLHSHYAPVPHRSRIAFPMYTSDDYIVFIPDIVYRDGYPGESALNAVNPGIFKLVEAGFIDRERIALQGHSWGGYQIAFMVTRSERLYRAAAAGAPVANMTSAYGGIRRETGLVRQFQYERTQSRLGGNLWEMPLRYIENSPLFWVDKIETPLLIMHNDRDGHVPWEQGIELFVALRRLGKPAWMVNYRGEPHWPTTFPNRVDWNIRMKQFFDHFLKDAPPPAWMVEGIPAVRRGETLGYETVPGATVVEDRSNGSGNDGDDGGNGGR